MFLPCGDLGVVVEVQLFSFFKACRIRWVCDIPFGWLFPHDVSTVQRDDGFVERINRSLSVTSLQEVCASSSQKFPQFLNWLL